MADDTWDSFAEVPLTDVLALSRQRIEERLERLSQQGVDLEVPLRQSSGIERRPERGLLKLLPNDLSVRDFVRRTVEEDIEVASRRIGQCRTCPDEGGNCLRDERQGMFPRWDDGIRWTPCTLWQTHLLHRRLVDRGFPERHMTFENFRAENEVLEEKIAFMRMWVDDFDHNKRHGYGVVLEGGYGIGKTHLAVAAARELCRMRRVTNPLFWDYGDLMSRLSHRDDGSLLATQQAETSELLVLDDMNVERINHHAFQKLSQIISARWNRKRLTIVTTNEPWESIERTLGPRLFSRLNDMLMYETWEGRNWRDGDVE